MFLLIETVNVPPYCGVPSLSHQFPVALVVVVVCVTGDVVAGVAVVVVVDDVVVKVVVTIDAVVVDVAQDANASDIAMRQVSTVQIVFPPIKSPL